jgi:uncharacterized surface protein with fasciclin (FAS1) repeats
VTQAGLAGTLSEGSFTVFAPTDDAFSTLGTEMLDAVLADNDLLTNILLYHVVDEVLLSADLECNGSVRMANAEETTTVCANDCLYQKGNGNSWESLPRIVSQYLQTCPQGNAQIYVVNQVILPTLEDVIIETETEETVPVVEDERNDSSDCETAKRARRATD